ncbi:MAG: TRAP transporter large permease subunit [Janthinobacterium lividum]
MKARRLHAAAPAPAAPDPLTGPRAWHGLRQVARGFDHLVEAAAALLLLAEIVILGSGVVSRYVFDQPLVWSDELATMLFLWLSMLGAAIAVRRGRHMRLSFFVSNATPTQRRWLAAIGSVVVLGFLCCMLGPAVEHVQMQWQIEMPATGLPDGLRVLAIPVGLALMLIETLRRTLAESTLRHLAAALLVGALVSGALWWASPWFAEIGNASLLVFFVGLLCLCIAMGVPIAFSFGVAAVAYLTFCTDTSMSIVASRMEDGMSSLILLSIPLFVFLGALMEVTGFARVMIDFLGALVGHFRSGLQFVLLGAMFLVSGISGSKSADMAAVAPSLIPEIEKRGGDPAEMVALLAASGAMSETIPPSLVLITVGSVTGVSIAALFKGGLLPAVVGMLALGILVHFRSRRQPSGAAAAPASALTSAPASVAASHATSSAITRFDWSKVLRTFCVAIPALVLPFIVRGTVMSGIATATEVSTVAIFYTALVSLVIYRSFRFSSLYPLLVDAATLTGAVLLIVATANAMAWALTQSGFAGQIAGWVAGAGSKGMFLGISVLLFICLGSVLEGIPAIVLFGSILFPVARTIGVNEVHYAMVAVFSMGLGLFAPPFGVGFYSACGIAGIDPDRVVGKMWPYLGALLVAVVIIAAVPWISTSLL